MIYDCNVYYGFGAKFDISRLIGENEENLEYYEDLCDGPYITQINEDEEFFGIVKQIEPGTIFLETDFKPDKEELAEFEEEYQKFTQIYGKKLKLKYTIIYSAM